MRILFVSSEVYPLAKTGGLADVSAALPRALAALGVDIRLVQPAYPSAMTRAADKVLQAELHDVAGQGSVRVFSARTPDSGLPIWLVDCPALFDRPGGPYQDETGAQWADNAERFALLSRVAAAIARGTLVPGWQADIVHANDWHTGLLPVLLGTGARPRTLFTIHNLAFQGLFPLSIAPALGLPDELLSPAGLEFWGQVSFLKAGIRYADRVSTVSPNYAREILGPQHGCGLDGVLRERSDEIAGILNGVDYAVWDPARDAHLPAGFSDSDLSGKHVCKIELQREFGLPVDPDTLLMVWNSRLTHQKMADTVLEILPALLRRHVQVAIMGEGGHAMEQALLAMGEAHPDRLAVRIGYDEAVAHRLSAGGDLLLHPSRFEPCGLSPLYALRYGTLPLVRAVGGLADTIVDVTEGSLRAGTANGFAFRDATPGAMLACAERALAVHAQPVVWRRMQHRAMIQDFGWERSARCYLDIYRVLAPDAALVAGEEGEAAGGGGPQAAAA